MYRLAPARCARRPKQPANRSRNLPSRSSTARAVDTDKSTAQHTKLLQKSTVRIIGSLVRKNGSDKVLLTRLGDSSSSSVLHVSASFATARAKTVPDRHCASE